jgi:aryl-alcohol dehydrogenase-like predicted oxidoreductase
MKTIKLGNPGLMVPQLGLGCMGMTFMNGWDIYGKADETELLLLYAVRVNWAVTFLTQLTCTDRG